MRFCFLIPLNCILRKGEANERVDKRIPEYTKLSECNKEFMRLINIEVVNFLEAYTHYNNREMGN